MTKAEQKAIIAYLPEINEHSVIERADYNEKYRKVFIEGYRQAEEDLALTSEDVGKIFNKVRELQKNYSATVGCYAEVAKWFNEQRKEENK